VYLYIHDNEAEIRPANHLWDTLVAQTQDMLKAGIGDPKSRVICIGPAGEKRVRFANMIAFAMECFENGWITAEETDGIELTWGNMDSAKVMVEKIINREGLGRLLGEGVRRAAEKIGKGSSRAAMLNEYYRERGWDLETGIPTSKKLLALKLEKIVGDEKKL
jgi:aldehyde:ferredoxin oxidoreductase